MSASNEKRSNESNEATRPTRGIKAVTQPASFLSKNQMNESTRILKGMQLQFVSLIFEICVTLLYVNQKSGAYNMNNICK